MKRYAITISYNGTKYFGWQRQPREISVQQVIEESLTKIHHNLPIAIVGCGRTDTGVHAKSYVLHVDLPQVNDLKQFIYKMNKMLPKDICFQEIKEVSGDFHARFDAKDRTYRYFVHTQKDVFKVNQSFYINQSIDFERMNLAAKYLLEASDFSSFAKTHTDVKTNFCKVTKAEWIAITDTYYYFEISADRFLRNMVRAVVGTLLEIGLRKQSVEEMSKIIQAKNRSKAGMSVPAHALYLWNVTYK